MHAAANNPFQIPGILIVSVIGIIMLIGLFKAIRSLLASARGLPSRLVIASSRMLINTLSSQACKVFSALNHSRASIIPVWEAKEIIRSCTSKCDQSFDGLKMAVAEHMEEAARVQGGYSFAMILAEICFYAQSGTIMQSVPDDPAPSEAILHEAFEVGRRNGLFIEDDADQSDLAKIFLKVIERWLIVCAVTGAGRYAT